MNSTPPDALDRALDDSLRRQFVPRVPPLAEASAHLWWLLPIAAALPLVFEVLHPAPERVPWERAWSALAAQGEPLEVSCSMGLDLRPTALAKLGEGLDLRMQAPAFDARLIEDPRYAPWVVVWSQRAQSLLLVGRSEWEPRPALGCAGTLALHTREMGALVACEINAGDKPLLLPLLDP